MTIRTCRTISLLAITTAFTLVALFSASPTSAEPDPSAAVSWQWPLDPRPPVVRVYQPPDEQWTAGHRGVDLAGSTGQPVHAVAAGVVSFASSLAGRGVVVVTHGDVRSTYEPVTAAVHLGVEVSAGEVIGLLQSVQSHCLPSSCLHLGAKRGDTYLDPLSLLGPQEVRLKPLAGAASDDDGAAPGRTMASGITEPGSRRPEEVRTKREAQGTASSTRDVPTWLPLGGFTASVSALALGATVRRRQARG